MLHILVHSLLIKHCFFLFIQLEAKSMEKVGFFSVREDYESWFFAVLLGTTSKYVFLPICLAMTAQNTASLQYAVRRNCFSTFIAVLDLIMCTAFLLRLQFKFSHIQWLCNKLQKLEEMKMNWNPEFRWIRADVFSKGTNLLYVI